MKQELEQALRAELEKSAFAAHADQIVDEVMKSWEEMEKMASPGYGGLGGAAGAAPIGAKIFDFVANTGKNANDAFGKSLGSIGAAALGGAAILGALKAGKAIAASGEYKRFMSAVQQAIQMNQILQHADRDKVISIAETIFKYAPTAAADPHLLSSILSNAVMMDGMDPQVVRSLIDLERGHRDTKSLSITGVLARG